MKGVVLCVLAAILSGCASIPDPKALQGRPFEQIQALLGVPTYELKLANGNTRRFYTDAASLVRTWRADFDAGDRVLELAPATTSAEFAEAVPGISKKADLLERFGLPYKTETFAESGRSSLFYLHNQYGMKLAYMVLTCDSRDVLVKAEVLRIDAPVSVHSRPDIP